MAECNLGVGRLATSLRINGFFDAGASRIVEIYIYNYTTASYDKLSAGTAATEMRKNTSDKDYEFALTSAHTDPSISVGEVKIKFLSAQSNAGDTLNLDFVVTTGEASGSSSGAAIADAIANSNWGESVNHIPRFTGELFYIAGSVGDDGNSGKYPDSGLATISATVAKAAAGDYLKVFAASFNEAVDLNKDGLELHGEIGATITGNGGVPLTISANDCKIDEIILTPAAGQIGLVITGNYNKISILRVNGGLIAIQDTGIGNKITLVEADEYTGTGFDLQGTGARLLKCFAISSQPSTRGFYLSNTAADRTIIEESTSVNNDTAGFEVVADVTNALIADCVESITCGARIDNGTNTSWRNHSTTDHQLLQAKEATLNTAKTDLLEAILTRLASSVYGSSISPSDATVADGTVISGDYTDLATINQTYWKIQESGSFKLTIPFTGLSSIESVINMIYRYFGPGSTNHKIKIRMWNYNTPGFVDVTSDDHDFPSTEQDTLVRFNVPGDPADYFTGGSPNIAAILEIEHISNAHAGHEFWADFVTLGELERIYVPADNTGITAIDEAVEHTIYGLSALQVLLDAIPTNPVTVLSATGYVKDVYWASGGKFKIKESEDINIPFWFDGNPTGLDIWFVIAQDLKNGPLLVKKQLIEGTDWNIVQKDGVDRVEGTLPFIYTDTDTLHGEYTAAAIVKTAADKSATGWESTLIISRPVAKAGALM